MFIDTHAHLSYKDYDNIDFIIKKAFDNNVRYIIICCCSMNDIDEGLNLVKKYSNLYLTIGLHPSEILNYTREDLEYIKSVAISNKKVVAIGEIGLDYHYLNSDEDKILQRELFIGQLNIAEEIHKPVVIHTREATRDTIDILKNYKLKGDIHCFSGSIETANEYIKLGYKLGIGGVLTFKNSKLSIVLEKISLDNILLETDSPYLSPEPLRGTKNESSNILYIANKISDVKQVPVEEVGKITTCNAISLFDLDI